MERVKKGWLYGIIVMLSQTCNPNYEPFKGGQKYSMEEEEEMIEFSDQSIEVEEYELPPPPPPPPPMAPDDEMIFKVVEEMPRFPGCEDMTDRNERKTCSQEKMLKFIYAGMKYPATARKEGVEGTAVIQFAVAKNGDIENVRLLRDPGAGCGEEAVRVVKTMPKWIPGKQRGRTVKVQYNLPMKFKL